MDRVIYVGMTAAKHTMSQLASVAQNLSNIQTVAYKADVHVFKAIPASGPGNPTREYVVNAKVGTDFSPGTIEHTGNPTDLAIVGPGWFTVKMADGSEAYTRNGNFKISANGVVQTTNGLSVVGVDGGPITLPLHTEVSFGRDGTITSVPSGNQPSGVTVLGKIKLVNPPEDQVVKGADNFIRLKNGQNASADASVRLMSGSLEASNVNAIEAMINMIDLGRQFDMQMKLLQTADANASKASVLLNING